MSEFATFVHPNVSAASILSVLRVFYQCCECFISITSVLSNKRLFQFSSTSIYEISTLACLELVLAYYHTSIVFMGFYFDGPTARGLSHVMCLRKRSYLKIFCWNSLYMDPRDCKYHFTQFIYDRRGVGTLKKLISTD